MGRVQLLTFFLSIVILLVTANFSVNTDAHALPYLQTDRITIKLNTQSVTFVSHLITPSHRVVLRTPALSQMPDLHNGCEVTSLTMLLNALHITTTNTKLAALIHKDPTPLQLGTNGQILRWGNPNVGFVGSVTGNALGYGVYHHPIAELLNKMDPGQALDLTGSSFEKVLSVVTTGRPVVVWTTLTFAPVRDWINWQSPEGTVHATLYEHAVLLVGFDKNHVFVNNPLTGEQAESVPLNSFEKSWVQMGRQAVTVLTLK